MTGAAGLTLFAIAGSLALLAYGYAADAVLLGALLFLVVGGVLPPEVALHGFANTGMLTVAALFVVAAGLRDTGAISLLSGFLMGGSGTERSMLRRLVVPTVIGSAFLNNTTIVAALLPAVHGFCKRTGIPASRLLLPLSYAAILGGTCTLIGTSTNLVVSGLYAEAMKGRPDYVPIGFLDITWVGLPVAIVGGLLMVLLAPRLLPDRVPAISRGEDPKGYTVELFVPKGSRLAGKTVEAAGLRHLAEAYLVEIDRGEAVLPAVESDAVLLEGDRLVFVGGRDALIELQRLPGLEPAMDQVFKLEGDRHERPLVEAVVSERNRLLGKSIKAGAFRTEFQAVVLGVAREGERLRGRIGDVVLAAGDVLLLEAHPSFLKEQQGRADFYLASEVPGAGPVRKERAPVALTVLSALVFVTALGLLDTVVAAFLAAFLMVATGCVSMVEARKSVDGQVLVAIAAAFGLGAAMERSGLAQGVARLVIDVGAAHPLVALVLVYAATVLVTEIVTNNAAAALGFPLAMSIAERLAVSPMPFVIAVMMAASASFLTPIGYQTNLMVYGPGGYRPQDYLRLGAPLTLAVAITTLSIIPWVWPF